VNEEALIRKVLKDYRKVAVVGLSSDPGRPSHGVAWYLKEHGYEITPVNPQVTEVFGLKAYPDLNSVPGPIEIVDVFRSSDKVMPVVEEAIKVGAKVVWMQSGVINEEAAAKARAAGLDVIMNRFMHAEHAYLEHGETNSQAPGTIS
jgi:predicted CoA-binding protein